MRNLKKVLALVLALVMAMSLVTIANASDFTDADEITYEEAVDVMSAIGVIDGLDTGAFNPTGTLTREQAAKIICTMLLGENADKLGTTSSSFTDVLATRWSSPYIEYCVQTGIVAGNGDGTFNPTGKLTGYAFAKMLLVALGYDASIQKYTGAGWNVNVAKDAVTAGIDVDGVLMSNDLTREQATQMAFQTLTADMVKYDNKGTSISMADGTSVVIGASDPEKVANSTSDDYNVTVSKRDNIQQFCEQYFSKLKLTANGSDDFGRSASKWTYKSKDVGTYADEADVSYTAKVKVKEIYADLGLSKNVTATTVTNGTPSAAVTISKTGTTEIGAQGQLIEVFYDADAETVEIVYIDTYVGKVSAVYSNVDDPYVTISALSTGAASGQYETTSFEKDDIVLYTYADGEIQSLALAEKLEGQEVTSYTGANNAATKLTADGTAYKAAAQVKYGDSLVANSSYDLYLDAYGNVIYVKLYEGGVGNYAYVLECGSQGGIYTGDTDYYAKLLFADGTMKSVKTAKDYSVAYNAGSAPNGGGNLQKFIVSYTLNDDDEYVLTAKSVAAAAADTIKLIPGTSKVDLTTGTDFYANSSTIFVVAEKDGSDVSYKAYTGIANAPKIGTSSTGAAVSYIVAYGTGSVADYVFIEVNSGVISSDSDDMIFVKGATKTAADKVTAGSTEYYVYTAFVNGEETELKVLASATTEAINKLTANVFLKSITYNSNGYVTSVTPYTTTGDITVLSAADGTRAESNGTIGFNYTTTVWYTYADDVAVYVVDGSDASVGSIASITDDSNDGYIAIVDGGEVTAIAITKNGVATPTITGLTAQTITLPTNSASLSASVGSTAGTTTYKWTATGGTIADDDAASTTITFAASGTYTVTLTVKNTLADGTSASTSASATITVNPAPAA